MEGTLNKQTKEEIQDAVRRAQQAYEIATQSLLRDVSSYSFDKYQRELASPVGLKNLEDFTLKYLGRERRQVQRRDGFYEFLTPEALQEYRLQERYKTVTFDRSVAIKNAQAQFFALGHPFVDAMLQKVGDYSFGGHTALRLVGVPHLDPREARTGFQFNFIVRSRVEREDGNEYLFDFYTVVVSADRVLDEQLASWAASEYSKEGPLPPQAQRQLRDLESLPLEEAYHIARDNLEARVQLWDWDEDVDLIGVARLIAVAAE